MIKTNKGNLLDVTSGIIVHGCNAQGVMGSGIALAVKQKYPGAYEIYKSIYEANSLFLGDIAWYEVTHGKLFIANAVTQEKYGRDGKRYVNYAAIVQCFKEAISTAYSCRYDLHFPCIGAGLGGGDWYIIEQLINDCDPKDKVSKNLWVLE